MDVIPYEENSFYIFDRGYKDFKRLHNIERSIYEMLQIVSISLTDTTNLKDLFAKPNCNIVNELVGSTDQVCLIVKLYNNRPELLPDSNGLKQKMLNKLHQT